jgi:hypothetical protein
MNSFTSTIRAKVRQAYANKVSGEQIREMPRQMEVLNRDQLRCVVGGDDGAPKGSWLASNSALS